MNEQFNEPKGFGEILDHTFRLGKNHFKEFFMILLIVIGPVYLLQALFQLLSGTNLFREVGSGNGWLDQIITSFEEGSTTSANLGSDFGLILLSIVSTILIPVALVATLYAVNHIKKGESFTPGVVIKRAFSRFWPILWSSLLLFVITVAMLIIPIIVITIIGIIGSVIHPIIGVIFGILFFLGIGLVVALLLTRWSFYLGEIAFGNKAPAIGRSWNLTRNRMWILLGIYIVFLIITNVINTSVELPIMFLLGNSVLYSVILSVVSLFTLMFFMIGYAIVYFDLKIRRDADDLEEMIEEYHE